MDDVPIIWARKAMISDMLFRSWWWLWCKACACSGRMYDLDLIEVVMSLGGETRCLYGMWGGVLHGLGESSLFARTISVWSLLESTTHANSTSPSFSSNEISCWCSLIDPEVDSDPDCRMTTVQYQTAEKGQGSEKATTKQEQLPRTALAMYLHLWFHKRHELMYDKSSRRSRAANYERIL